MKNKTLILFLLIGILLSFAILNAVSGKQEGNERKRILAHNELEVSEAMNNGCSVIKEIKKANLSVLTCPAGINLENINSKKKLKLREDRLFYAQSEAQNIQVGADLVHLQGNTGQGRKIVILDSGYNYLHPELASSYLGGWDFVNGDSDPMDDNGHGSHVAGIITADGIDANAKGVAPDAGIVSGKILDANLFPPIAFESDVIAGIYWSIDGNDGIYKTADDWNADAISMSIGTNEAYPGFCDSVYPELKAAIDYAVERNVPVVVAAGNKGNLGITSPGCISSAITVGNVKSDDTLYTTSGRNGLGIDITAPGVSIYSTWLGTSYNTMSGTSMATPVVSGVIALLRNIPHNSSYSREEGLKYPNVAVFSQIQSLLFSTSKDLIGSLYGAGWDNYTGWGRVQAFNFTETCKQETNRCDVYDGYKSEGAEASCLSAGCLVYEKKCQGADANRDGVMNFLDYGPLDSAFIFPDMWLGQCSYANLFCGESGELWNVSTDMNQDGVLNFLDYGIIDSVFIFPEYWPGGCNNESNIYIDCYTPVC